MDSTFTVNNQNIEVLYAGVLVTMCMSSCLRNFYIEAGNKERTKGVGKGGIVNSLQQ